MPFQIDQYYDPRELYRSVMSRKKDKQTISEKNFQEGI